MKSLVVLVERMNEEVTEWLVTYGNTNCSGVFWAEQRAPDQFLAGEVQQTQVLVSTLNDQPIFSILLLSIDLHVLGS